ncbi:MAG: 2-phosphosulfolactate phosphatase [Candidatus Limimorpha sp.]
MRVQVVGTAQSGVKIDCSSRIAVVIDVLRATSVMTTALDNGARSVLPVTTIEEAETVFKTSDPACTLKGGERHALKIDGFDFGNSPLEYKRPLVAGKDIIITTTNGTNAIRNVQKAEMMVLACLRNASAVVGFLIGKNKDVVIVCSGTEGKFSMDDGLCAGMLLHLLKEKTPVEWDDLGFLLERFYRNSAHDIFANLLDCFHVKRLLSLGFHEDLKFCFQTDRSTCIPMEIDGRFVRMG